MSGRIIVGYTATKSGRDAVAFASRWARATGSAVHVVIVLPSEGRSVITPPNPGYERYLHDQAEGWLAEAAEGIHDDVARESEVRYAESFAEGLVAAAHETGASAIVIGSASGGPRGHHRLGSTSTELVHSSDVPVVLVPRGERKSAATGVGRLTAAIGTRPGAEALLDEAVELARRIGVPLRLLSIATVDLPASVDTGIIRLAGAAHAGDVLTAARASLPREIEVDAVTAHGESVEEAIDDVEWKPDDVVLVGSSRLAQPRRLFLGSTATKMLHKLPVPVIVVPRTRKEDGAAAPGAGGLS